MLSTIALVAEIVAAMALAFGLWYFGQRAKAQAEKLQADAEQSARRTLAFAEQEAEQRIKDAAIEAREKLMLARAEFDRDTQQYRQELLAIELRLDQRETTLDER